MKYREAGQRYHKTTFRVSEKTITSIATLKKRELTRPKLGEGENIYGEKIKPWFEKDKVSIITVIIMQVPCYRGWLNLAGEAPPSLHEKNAH